MFEYSIVQLYFLTNMVYTLIIFFFFHNSIVERRMMVFKKLHSRDLTEKEIRTIMNTFYIISAFLGSIKLFQDTLNLILDHKSCLWLHWIYRNKAKKKVENKEE